MDLLSVFYLIIVAIGFGFVIFWHELGHFLAAKWAGVRVEQFAIGFGNAIVSYRQGLGVRFGTSGPEYQQLLQQERDGIQGLNAGAVSPTEYRLNWIPLGGYVKMYGQEDMVASTTSDEPDHYMNKGVGKRMVIISAGVVMNVILAAILFTILFWMGYHPPAPVIGTVIAGGPAHAAGLNVGDTVLEINGSPQYAWTNVGISTALLKPEVPAVFTIQPAGTGTEPSARRKVEVTPRTDAGYQGMVGVGIGPAPALRGVDPRFVVESDEALRRILSNDQFAVLPGEEIVEIQGRPVGIGDYHVLHNALVASDGGPIDIVVRTKEGSREARQVRPRLSAFDGNAFAGLLPLVEVLSVNKDSPNAGKLMPGDIIERLTIAGTADAVRMPSYDAMKQLLAAAGEREQKVSVAVHRNGQTTDLGELDVIIVDRKTGQYGLGFRPTVDSREAVVGGIEPDSPAAAARVPAHGRIIAAGGRPTASWFDVYVQLRDAARAGSKSIEFSVQPEGGEAQAFAVVLDEATLAEIAMHEPVAQLQFVLDPELGNAAMLKTTLQTSNPLQAIWWGVRETRDQILNLYLTLKRVTVDRTVSPKNLTGPVGIFQFGTVVARNGPDWLIWFLAMISANLAVVNFLPVPILDGGHMVFLASEKITGRPPSPKVQTAALYAGLLLIVGLVLFVTYNDLQRLLFL
jgi:regulator of sigma E protease